MNQRITRPLVVVGVDGSEESVAAVDWAATYARRMGGTLQIATAWRWPTSYGVPLAIPDFDPEADARTLAEKVAAGVDLPPDQIRTVVVHGTPAQVLLGQADEADLIVVGCRGLGGFSGALLGSVSAYLVHHAPCPVTVVR